MEVIINTICLSVLVVLEIVLYLMLASKVIPRILKLRYSLCENSGRGLKKYVYPSGRGISYEPVPAVRKYINRYLLFTNNGYKYLKCRIDAGIREIDYTVIMLNNQNKVIDVIAIKGRSEEGSELEPVLVHCDTSYVELVVDTVNGKAIDNDGIAYYRVTDMIFYTLSMAALSFAELMFAYDVMNLYFSWWKNGGAWADIDVIYFVVLGVFIGLVCGAMALLNARARKIGWSK